MANPIDYQAVLADLRSRRRQLDSAIASIELILGGSASTTEPNDSEDDSPSAPDLPPVLHRPANGADIRNDTFFGLSTMGAIKKYLNLVKRPQSPKAIAEVLRAGGQVHAVDDRAAYVNVYSALRKALVRGETVQIKSGEWGLAEWYSNKPKPDVE